jgi:ArsR family transcriptional regulator, arsenate/arsenite/antimonite-responsive transcriptional repressor
MANYLFGPHKGRLYCSQLPPDVIPTEIAEYTRGTMSESTNDQARRAAMFKALGDPTRLRIFEILGSCCDSTAVDVLTIEKSGDIRPVQGSTVGEICCKLNGAERISSTISHHLKELRLAGLITTERCGKHIICRVNQAALGELLAYLGNYERQLTNATRCCEPVPVISVTTKSTRLAERT